MIRLIPLLFLFGCQTAQTAQPTIIAQPMLRCAPAPSVIQFLKTKYDEDPKHTGIFNNGIIITIFVSKAKTFTIVHTGIKNQIRCLVSSGHNFKKIDWEGEKSV